MAARKSFRQHAGSTERGTTDWKIADPDLPPNFGLYVDIDISDCGFQSRPIVVTSIHGKGYHWELTGPSAVYNVTRKKFRVYVKFPTLERGQEVGLSPTFANDQEWHVQWIAVGS